MFDCTGNNTLPFINKPPNNTTNRIECHDTNSNQTDRNNILLPSDVNQYLSEAIELHPCCMEITNQCKGNTNPSNNFDCGERRDDKQDLLNVLIVGVHMIYVVKKRWKVW